MPVSAHRPEDIRNVVLIGAAASGKTTLAEAMLHRAGAIQRMGSIQEANTTSDFEAEAKAHQHSTSATLLFAEKDGREINLVDTPGHTDLVGQALSAMPAVETAILVVPATGTVDFHARRLFFAAGELGLSRMVVINKIDLAPAGLAALVDRLKATLGPELHCINLPTRGGTDVIDCFDEAAGKSDFGSVAEVHREMLESTVEIDDAALERYLGGQPLDLAELRRCFIQAMTSGHVVPILFTAAKSEVGVDDLLHILCEDVPSPLFGRPRRIKQDGEVVEVPCDTEKPLLAHCFKVTTDAYLGKLAMLRVLQGRMDGQTPFLCGPDRKVHRAGHVLKVEGRDHPELEAMAFAGDLVAVAKIDEIHAGQILHSPALEASYEPVGAAMPTPMLSLAIETKTRADEVKLMTALERMSEEDPTFHARMDSQTRELVVSGLGDTHLRVALEKLQSRFKMEVTAREPRIPYRETLTAKAEGHYKHRKQTGGARQFAEVYLRVEPLPRGGGFEFASEVFGGTIPTQYIPAVEKGVRDALESGELAGYPVEDVRVVVYDGKSHPVDSKDIAFRTAGKFAFRDAYARARPVLLEPVAALELFVPEGNLGDVTGDLKTRRGRVNGMDPQSAGVVVLHAQAPFGELSGYGGQVRGMTGGHGSFVMELSHYDVVPPNVAQKVIAARKPWREEE